MWTDKFFSVPRMHNVTHASDEYQLLSILQKSIVGGDKMERGECNEQ